MIKHFTEKYLRRQRRKAGAEKKLLEIKELEQTIQSFRASATARVEEKKTRLTNNLLAEIREAASAKAKTAGYAMVLNTAAETITISTTTITIPSPVFFSNGENDLTDAVLAQLNANAPLDLPKDNDSKSSPPATSDKK